MTGMFRVLALSLALVAGSAAAFAQTPDPSASPQAAPAPPTPPRFTVRGDALFYANNDEFANPFRSGETFLGASGRLFLDMLVDTHATLRVGAFTNGRFVSQDRLGEMRVLCSFILAKDSQRFVFGTLETVERREGIGPDVTTLHGLLPPIQIETLALTRPYETGLQWTVSGVRASQDVWINWQLLNTREHREKFDAGVVGRLKLGGPVHLGYQWHIAHHGGQQFASGPVSDSYAVAPGLVLAGQAGSFSPSFELYWVRSSDDPNRSDVGVKRIGNAGFLRVAVTRSGWRVHGIAWSGSNFIKEEGDLNYQSVGKDGSFVSRQRHYYETGVTRLFLAAKDVFFEGSFRLFRIEDTWSYAYRFLAKVNIEYPLKAHRP
jgi:hypothetical protein